MSDRSRWESKRRSPDAQQYRHHSHHHSNSSESRSSSSDRHKNSYYREKDRDRDREYDRNRENDRDKERTRERERERERDCEREKHRERERDYEKNRRDRDREKDWRQDRNSKYNRDIDIHSADHRRDSDRFNKNHYESSHKNLDSTNYSSKDGHEKRPKTPPYPPSFSSMSHVTVNKFPDNSSSSGYASSPFSATPPPPPPQVLSITQKLTSFLIMNKPRESTPPLIQNKTVDPRRQNSKTDNKKEPVKTDLRNYKLLIDPVLKKGHTKIFRYDGVLPGQPPVTPKDPRQRKTKIWTLEVCDLPVPKFSVDKNYVGPMPRDTIRFSNLNDNIDRKFLLELCEAYGDIIEYKVYFDPQNNKHMGTGKVVFDANTNTEKVVSSLNGRSVMGKIVKAWIEIKNPPGYSIWKQLEVECKARNVTRAAPQVPLGQQIASLHQSTPPTPMISSVHRNHPIAQNFHPSHYQTSGYSSPILGSSEHPPPPPPPKSNNYHRESGPRTPPPPPAHNRMRGPSTPPPPPLNTHKIPHGTAYSPVSDQSASPRSPAPKEETAYEAISDTEQNGPHLEDISPAATPLNGIKKVEEEDDNMSLSSISSNEGNKVELNVQNTTVQRLPPVPPSNPNPSAFQMPRPPLPPNFVPRMNLYPHAPPGINTSIPPPNFIPPLSMPYPVMNPTSSSSTNTASSSNMQQMRLNTPNSQPTFMNPRHTEMIQNVLRRMPVSHTHINQQSNLSQLLLPKPHIQPPTMLPQQIPQEPILPSHIQEQPTPPINTVEELPYVFQVKAGCARDISQELKRILSKDTLKKLVEQSAFKAFENWWEKQKSFSQNRMENVEQKVTNLANHVKSVDRKPVTNNDDYKENLNPTKKSATTDLFQSLFAREKNNGNNPGFLSSFRISRRPQPTTQSRNKAQVSRKRRPWPRLSESKRKQQRLEESDEESDEGDQKTVDEESGDEDQLERFISQQRKSGASLYQKIYSDDSDEEDTGYNDTQSDEEEDNFIDDRKIQLESESSFSSDGESSSESSSETSSESEDELTEPEESSKEESNRIVESKEEDLEVTKTKESIEGTIEDEDKAKVTEDEIESMKKEAVDEGGFRSMYDEPRRAAVEKAKKNLGTSIPKSRKVKSEKPPPAKRAKKAPRIIEESSSSETESASETEAEERISDAEERITDKAYVNRTGDEKERVQLTKDKVKVSEENDNDVPSTEELINNLIMLEHNYFEPLNKKSEPDSTIEIHEQTDNTNNKIKTVKRPKDSPEKGELKYKFQMRTKEEEDRVIWSIYDDVIDSEDLNYMKGAFESLQQVAAKEIESYTWVDTTLPPLYKPKRTKGEAKLRVHKTGCARSEGYYKIPIKEKAQYLKSALRHITVLKQRDDVDQKTASSQASAEQKMKSRENRAMQRRLASSFAQEEFASLINYNQQLKIRKKALRFAKSSIHNWGLFTLEPIAAEEFVCEYVGQMVRSIVAELREQRYEKNGIGSSYLFRLDMESVIDATKSGCNARFINHSCQPNCYAKVILVEGAKKIVIYSKQDIALGEEITYDYKFPLEDEKIPCLCGAPQCRGSLN